MATTRVARILSGTATLGAPACQIRRARRPCCRSAPNLQGCDCPGLLEVGMIDVRGVARDGSLGWGGDRARRRSKPHGRGRDLRLGWVERGAVLPDLSSRLQLLDDHV